MPSWTHRTLRQDITYWPPNSSQGDFGFKGHLSPVLLKGRVEKKAQLIIDPSGSEIVSNTSYFLSAEVQPGGALIEGNQTASSLPIAGSQIILQSTSLNDMRNAAKEHRAFT